MVPVGFRRLERRDELGQGVDGQGSNIWNKLRQLRLMKLMIIVVHGQVQGWLRLLKGFGSRGHPFRRNWHTYSYRTGLPRFPYERRCCLNLLLDLVLLRFIGLFGKLVGRRFQLFGDRIGQIEFAYHSQTYLSVDIAT